MKTIEITIPEGKEAKWVNNILTLVDVTKVTERIKTFEDAYNELGCEHPFCKAWDSIYQGDNEFNDSEDIKDVIAYHKLRIIVAALMRVGNLSLRKMSTDIIHTIFSTQNKSMIIFQM